MLSCKQLALHHPQASAKRAVRCGAAVAPTLVKVCGVTNVEDAEFAAKNGANFIGMIMWPKAKRSISIETAASIAAAARAHGAQPIGVFVDEDADTIASKCKQAGIDIAQLHGDDARKSLLQLPEWLQVVYVMHALKDGSIKTALPAALAEQHGQQLQRQVDWLLVDGLQGGSGETYDWTQLQVPHGSSTKGWLLAGGLGPDNIAEAVALARPTAVDVSSGVCGPDGLKKDLGKVKAFIDAAKSA